ncbi:MAG: transcriptional regulator [Microbacteriaceae bacterium]|nr:transcriptional regulator [Microbacteriaceae bacterium]
MSERTETPGSYLEVCLTLPTDASVTEPAVRTDPRIRRTRLHVLDVAREMLNEHSEALTFTAVAERAFVARQTLYKHWGSIENLIAETVVVARVGNDTDYEGLTTQQKTLMFLERLGEQIDAGMASAIAAIIAAASYEPDSRRALGKLDTSLFDMFRSSVGPVTHDQFIEIVAPVMYLIVSGGEVTPGLVASIADRSAQLLDN